MDFTLPELGEQIEAGDVLRVLVKAGDTLVKDQPVLELETDKATIEVPSSVAGTVKEIKVKAGDKVKVGQAILSYEEGATAKPADAKTAPAPAAAPANADAAPKAGGGRKAQAAQAEGGASKQASAKSAPAKAADGRGGPKEKVDDNEEGQPD